MICDMGHFITKLKNPREMDVDIEHIILSCYHECSTSHHSHPSPQTKFNIWDDVFCDDNQGLLKTCLIMEGIPLFINLQMVIV